jgi:hypothetical protein
MVCTARSRSQLYGIDGRWMLKFRLRVVHNVLCAASIACAALTLGNASKFQPNAFKNSSAVLYYVPAVSEPLSLARTTQSLLCECAADGDAFSLY